MNMYGYTFTVECPNGGAAEYTLLILHDEMIMAEDIVKACEFAGPMYHEFIADHLRAELPGRQTLSGEHAGVEVETVR